MSAAIFGLLTSYKADKAEYRAAKAGAEIAQLQKEKRELQAKVVANQNEIASLQKRIEGGVAATKPSKNPSVEPAPKQQSTPLPPSLEIKLGAASTPEQPTPPPPSPEIKPEHLEETTPPPQRPKRQKMTPIKAPQVAGQPGTMSISSAKALATYAPAPPYPSKARLDGITGSGVCVVSVDPGTGNVTEALMAQSTGNQTLDKATVSAFRRWVFKPGKVSTVRIPVDFTLTGAPY